MTGRPNRPENPGRQHKLRGPLVERRIGDRTTPDPADRRRRTPIAGRTAVGHTDHMVRMVLEAFWPSRRIVQFDELCRPAA